MFPLEAGRDGFIRDDVRDRRSRETRGAGRGTHEEAELAVVAAELDGRRERGGREEDRGDADDGSLRRRERKKEGSSVSRRVLRW